MTQQCHYWAHTLRKITSQEKYTCTPMFIVALYTIARTWKQPRYPSTDEWINKMWYIDSLPLYHLESHTGILCVCVCVCVHAHSVIQSFSTPSVPWTIAHQAPLSMGLSGQEYWSGIDFLLQGIFPNQGLNLQHVCLLHWQADSLPLSHLGSPLEYYPAIERNKIESYIVMWMNLEPITRSEVSQKTKNKYYVSTYIYGI